MRRTLLFVLTLALLVQPGWTIRLPMFAAQDARAMQCESTGVIFCVPMVTTGAWNAHGYDLVFTVAFSRKQQPNGPLVVYRASGTDLRTVVPVVALQRGPLPLTSLFFPSPKGQYLALLGPGSGGYGTNLQGGTLGLVATDGRSLAPRLLVPYDVAAGDQVIWSADSSAMYYHSGVQQHAPGVRKGWVPTRGTPACLDACAIGYDEIHRVDLNGHDTVLWHRVQDGSSLRLVGLDLSGALIVTLARPHQPVLLLRVETHNKQGTLQQIPGVVATLPADILPGNVLRIGSDGESVECERVLNWRPLHTIVVRIGFGERGAAHQVGPLFDTARYGQAVTALNRSTDGTVLVMSHVLSIRADLAAEGIADVPAQESLLLADAHTGAVQRLTLPYGAQIVQTFWTAHIPLSQLHIVPAEVLAGLLAFHQRLGGGGKNASVVQQDEWMLEGHANLLFDGPALPQMCYAYCPRGLTGVPHVSAAILHGVAYVESNWHQFNTTGYDLNGEPVGSPVESFDGGWGEFQQTWGMPPQCTRSGNCRSDAFKIQHSESYNIGVGIQSLINAWNATAGVVSKDDPNDPYKANDWFFAVWAYNGSYGNNPNDVPSSLYGKWYPGAPFRSIYEEYVWYYAAHPQYQDIGWTDNYLPSLGSSLLPPQSDFVNTSDSFVHCSSCSIPDWTPGSYDRDWVGIGAPDTTTARYFNAAFVQFGGEDAVGLPRDNGGGVAMHRWGAGWIQDFGGGAYLPGALMMTDGTTTPYWVSGGIWAQYSTVDHGAMGCHGYPTSVLTAFPNSGPDTYLRQNFQTGSIIWDATTKLVVADLCS